MHPQDPADSTRRPPAWPPAPGWTALDPRTGPGGLRWWHGALALCVVVIVVLAALLLAGGRDDELSVATDPTREPVQTSSDPTAEASPQDGPTTAAPTPSSNVAVRCDYTLDGPPARPVQAPPAEAAVDDVRSATLVTDRGDLDLTLLPDAAPCTVNSFRHLANRGFYDDTPCHRLTTSGIFVLQCGDPSGSGRGGPGYVFEDENLDGASYPRGTVAMANRGPGTNGSQFFLVYEDSALPASYTPFGSLSDDALVVLDAIAVEGATAPDSAGSTAPVRPVTVSSVRVGD